MPITMWLLRTSLELSSVSGNDEVMAYLFIHGSFDIHILFTKSVWFVLWFRCFSWQLKIPYFKKGSRLDLNNYRPINRASILSITKGKIIEMVVGNYLDM